MPTFRIELFRCRQEADHFRARLWETEMFRIQPTFPANEADTGPCDETLLLEHSTELSRQSREFSSFQAAGEEEAMRQVIDDVTARLRHWTADKCPGIERLEAW